MPLGRSGNMPPADKHEEPEMSRHAARAVREAPAWKAHLGAAGLAALVTPALVLAGYAGRVSFVTALGVLQALLVLAWLVGTGLPGRIGGLLIGAGVAGVADLVLYARGKASLAGLLGVLALAVPALLVHQLSRGVVRV